MCIFTAAGGSDNDQNVVDFVSDFESKMTEQVKEECKDDSTAGDCDDASSKVTGMKAGSSSRKLLASQGELC
jgi:hypothetical protein